MFIMVAATFAVITLGAILIFIARAVKGYRQSAAAQGYATLGDYLRAAPRSDAEKREAVEMAMQGVVLCVLGFVFPPLLLIGIFPLYYGGRKVGYSTMGLGFMDDTGHTGA